MGKSIFYYKKLTFRFSYIIDLFVAYWLNKKAKKAQNQKMICFSAMIYIPIVSEAGVMASNFSRLRNICGRCRDAMLRVSAAERCRTKSGEINSDC